MLKKIKHILLAFLCLSLQVFSAFASDKVVDQKLYFDLGEQGGWIPYQTGAKTGHSGMLIDIANALQASTGIQFIAVHFPPRRAEKALIDGIVDFDFVCLEWLRDYTPGTKFVATDPFFEITEQLVTLKQNTHLFPTRQSMFGKRVGTVAGYFYFDDNEFIRSDSLNESRLIQGLKHNRFKVAILERETAKYWARINKTEIGFAALHTIGKLVMRVRKEHSALLPQLNQAIKRIKTSGELQAILDSHGVESQIY